MCPLRRRSGLFALVLLVVFGAVSFAQTFGTVTGVVTDSTGGVIVNATITVTNPDTNVTRTDRKSVV